MAEESTDKIAQMLLSLRNGENSSAFQPPLRRHANENFEQFSNPKPDVNLQLSLGGFYDNNTPNSAPTPCPSFANPDNSDLPKKFLPEEVAEVKITKEIQVITKQKDEENGSAETPEKEKSNEANPLVSPLGIPVWAAAAQSSFANPAFQRALNAIKSREIPSTPRNNDLRGYTSGNPRSFEGYGSRFSTHYQQFKNGNPMRTPISNGMNQRFFMPQKQPENLNLVAPAANSPCACQNFIPNQQFQMPKFAPHFNCSLATMNQPPQWSTDGSLTTRHSMPAPFAPSGSSSKVSLPFPAHFVTRGHSIPIVPQHATTTYNNKPYNFPSNFFPNANVPPFLPISSSTNATVNPFMPYQPIQPFSGPAGARSVPLTDVINSSRVHQSPSNPPDYPCKRAKHDNPETGEAEQQLMKQLPIVVTTGGNPNGKRIEGLLYKYGSDEEVKIICVCHGCFFTPEEFVKHAGGGANVENPRQQISVLDYSDFLMKE